MTDAELTSQTHALLLGCLNGVCSEGEAVIALIALYEDAGRPFVADGEIISADNDPA